MNQSPSIGTLAGALAKAQAHYGRATKDAANPFFKSKYADLASCYEACRESLSANGLSVVQTTEITVTEKMQLVSMLIHSSGEWIAGTYPIIPVKADPQGYGSAITYARRYALMALVGIAPEDDDGNAASGKAPVKAATVTGEVKTKIPAWTDEQKKEAGDYRAKIMKLGGQAGDDECVKLRNQMKYDAPSDVVDALAQMAMKWEDIAVEAAEGGKQ